MMKYFGGMLTMIFLLTACIEQTGLKIVLIPDTDIQIPGESWETLKTQLSTELTKLGHKMSAIEVDEVKRELTVNLVVKKGDEFDVKKYESLWSTHQLNFWDTFRSTDEEITEFLKTIPILDDFTTTIGRKELYFPEVVIGFCSKKDRLDDISLKLNKWAEKYPGLKLFWSKDRLIDYSVETADRSFKLYMINTKEMDSAIITGDHVLSTAVSVDPAMGRPQIMLNFDSIGTVRWKLMTRAAALDGKRCIAMVINDKAYSVPTVMSEISGGKTIITGDFTMIEAQKLSNALNRKPFILPLKIKEIRIDED